MGSNLRRLLDFLHGKEVLVTSQYALTEAERNIMAKRPQWEAGLHVLKEMIELVPEASLSVDAGLPDKDKPILGAAIAAECEYLLTGDKRDFGHLFGQTVKDVTVMDTLTFANVMMMKKHQT